MSRRIQSTDLVSLARGAAFLGTGGGGDPYIGRLFAEQTILECGPPDMIDLEELPDTANVFTIGMMGAPTVMIEKLCCGDDALVALERLERHLGRQADAIMPVEIGGMNSTIPIAVAARRRLPLVDADGMGRAFPELQMVTFNVYGIPIAPFTLANEHGECTIIESRDARSGEDIARAITVRMGLAVMLCSYPMKGADAKRSAVAGTLSLAREIGAAIEEGRRSGDAVAALIRCLRRTP